MFRGDLNTILEAHTSVWSRYGPVPKGRENAHAFRHHFVPTTEVHFRKHNWQLIAFTPVAGKE